MGNTNSREGAAPSPPLQSPQSAHPKSVPSDAEACPVDHKTREVWLAQARQKEAEARIPTPSQPPQSIHPKSIPSDAEACPVDHKSREAWLAQARSKAAEAKIPTPSPTAPSVSIPAGESCDSTSISQSSPPPSAILAKLGLDQTREISTIPRATPIEDKATERPANNEIESGKDKSGKWIYPSEQMFFEAMRRKNYDPKAEDMKSIVPIHNAVNERAWSEILEWEKGQGSESYGSPFRKPLRFAGAQCDED
jgi:hypothetical protein